MASTRIQLKVTCPSNPRFLDAHVALLLLLMCLALLPSEIISSVHAFVPVRALLRCTKREWGFEGSSHLSFSAEEFDHWLRRAGVRAYQCPPWREHVRVAVGVLEEDELYPRRAFTPVSDGLTSILGFDTIYPNYVARWTMTNVRTALTSLYPNSFVDPSHLVQFPIHSFTRVPVADIYTVLIQHVDPESQSAYVLLRWLSLSQRYYEKHELASAELLANPERRADPPVYSVTLHRNELFDENGETHPDAKSVDFDFKNETAIHADDEASVDVVEHEAMDASGASDSWQSEDERMLDWDSEDM